MPKRFEYYVRHCGGIDYQVSKFDSMVGGEQPLATYDVKYNPSTGYGKCNCHAAVYRQTGSTDKHVLMVKEWIETGRKMQAIVR